MSAEEYSENVIADYLVSGLTWATKKAAQAIFSAPKQIFNLSKPIAVFVFSGQMVSAAADYAYCMTPAELSNFNVFSCKNSFGELALKGSQLLQQNCNMTVVASGFCDKGYFQNAFKVGNIGPDWLCKWGYNNLNGINYECVVNNIRSLGLPDYVPPAGLGRAMVLIGSIAGVFLGGAVIVCVTMACIEKLGKSPGFFTKCCNRSNKPAADERTALIDDGKRLGVSVREL